jgi:hypothetical protein
MAIGEFTSASTQPDPASGERQADLRAMDVALGLGHARTDFAAGVGPIIEGDGGVRANSRLSRLC